MKNQPADYLTTKELADLLRIKERKVYDLAAGGNVPCVRVVGKLLFPRSDILHWIHNSRSGPATEPAEIPAIVAGSHDPLLEWALRESGSGLAAFFDGSHDGLSRICEHAAVACGVHIHENDGWNVNSVIHSLGDQPVVLVEFARRQRGLIVAAGNPLRISGISDLRTRRFARRQDNSASQGLFQDLATETGIDPAQLAGPENPARTEDDVARLVLEDKADAAFGLAAVAHQFRLDFLPIAVERFDLVVRRKAWFDPPFQRLNSFLHSTGFSERAAEMGGYDITKLGTVHLNGPVG